MIDVWLTVKKGLINNIDTTKVSFSQVEKERKEIRRLLLPFDSAFFSIIAGIERESIKHYQNTFDSEIVFSLMKFYNLFEELNFLEIS